MRLCILVNDKVIDKVISRRTEEDTVHFTRSIFLIPLGCLFVSCLQSQPISTSLPWSVRMAESFMLRQPDSIFYPSEKRGARWGYEPGVMLEALRQVWTATDDRRYAAYIQREIDLYVTDKGDIRTYEYGTFNLDNIPTGRQLLWLHFENRSGKIPPGRRPSPEAAPGAAAHRLRRFLAQADLSVSDVAGRSVYGRALLRAVWCSLQ